MNIRYKNFLLYLIIVILPTVCGVLLYYKEAVENDKAQRTNDALWVASIHQKSWDQLIGETVTSLDMIALMAETVIDSPTKILPLLQSTHMKDPRYGGIYLLGQDGKVITGSNANLIGADFSSNEYIKEIIKSQDIIISNHLEKFENGHKVIGIGEPVIDNNGKLAFILVAHLRVDYIQNIMRLLTPDAKLSIVNPDGTMMMDINMDGSAKMDETNSISLPIDRLPWSIKVEVPKRSLAEINKNILYFAVLMLFVCHILFLFIKYLMLRRKAKRVIKENELQKLELVGTLAASTAHEIRNPLTGIKGLVQLLSEKYTNTQDQYYFSVINDEVNRINEIVSEFLILGKPTAQKTECIDIRSVFTELEPLIQSEANLNNVDYDTKLPAGPIYVDCTKDQLKQVLLNLTKNALEAMQGGGQLSVTLKRSANKCQIEIIDTGIGIPEEKIHKIFEPFYTSKDLGTGLGLVVCKRIIESFGGEIKIESEVNKGTNVNIFLPIC